MAELLDWCKSNKIQVAPIEGNLYDVSGEKYYFVEPKDDKLFDDEMRLSLTPEEMVDIINHDVQKVMYEFGENFYFTTIDLNEFNESLEIPIEFNDFKYIGEPARKFKEEFTHLGIHSEYELLNGSHTAVDWVEKAAFLGHTTLGICDKNTLSGTLAFQMACEKYGIKPIFGETVVTLYEFDDKEDETHDCKLYVMNDVGWNSLLQINKAINVDNGGLYITETELLKLGAGLIYVFTPNSIINKVEKVSEIADFVTKTQESFDGCYCQFDSVEYDAGDYDLEQLENFKRIKDSVGDELPFVLINDSYYIDPEEWTLKRYLNAISRKAYAESKDQYYKSLDDVMAKIELLFKEDEITTFFNEIVGNTIEIAEKCNFAIDVGEHKLPKFNVITMEECNGNGEMKYALERAFEDEYKVDVTDNEAIFFRLLEVGFDKKLSHLDEKGRQEYIDRLETEAEIIVGAGFIDYFLILWDIIFFARANNILVGCGRGSVGGSLIAYLLEITDIDPIKFDLLFERFLNKTRVSGERAKAADALPDIDVDFESARRDDIKRYMERKYGVDYVCSIGTYDRLKLKSSLKDFARVEKLKFSYVNYITSDIDNQIKYKWGDLFKYAVKEPRLAEFVQTNPKLVNTIKYSINQAKTASVHPSALVIVPREDKNGNPVNVFNWMPVKKVVSDKYPEGLLVSEWEGKYIDRAGFLKEDVLGIAQLDKFANILALIKHNRGEDIDLPKIPLDDRKTFKFFKKGHNEDVFQFGSAGLKKYSRQVKPDTIEDLIAMNALYRPGPMKSNAHIDFAAIKHGKQEPEFDYGLQEVTEKTHGLYIYQEQIMQAVHVLGGLSLTEADEIRTVMKKFDKDKMKTFRTKFIEGAVKNGCGKAEAVKVWIKLEKFSGYGFNRSHSAAYSLIAYWCQYLKVHYPVEFWTTAFQFTRDEAKIPYRISEMTKVSDIKIRTVDINKSKTEFVGNLEDNSIYWSILKIKGIGIKIAAKIIGDRRSGGDYSKLTDFMERMKGKGVGKDKVRNLILAGAFDNLYEIKQPKTRRKLLERFYKIIGEQVPREYYELACHRNYHWTLLQKSLTGFGDVDFKRLIAEKSRNMAKVYMTGEEFLKPNQNWKSACIAGQIMFVNKRKSKKGDFGVLTMQSNSDILVVVLWNEMWEKYKKDIDEYKRKRKLIAIAGKVKLDDWRGHNCLYSADFTTIKEL